MLRKALTAFFFVAGVVGSVATDAPADADVSGVSDDQTLVLSADNPTATITAAAHLVLDSPASVATGDIALNVQPDGDSNGGLSFTISGATDENSADVVDVASQGDTRIGIDAFAGCKDECTEELTLFFERTDGDGDLGLSFSLDGVATTDVASAGVIEFTID